MLHLLHNILPSAAEEGAKAAVAATQASFGDRGSCNMGHCTAPPVTQLHSCCIPLLHSAELWFLDLGFGSADIR